MAWRYLFGWAGGLTMLVSAYLYFLAPTPEHANGLLNRQVISAIRSLVPC